MIGLAWQTARARMTSLAGTFLALAVGVALLAVMALSLVSTLGGASSRPTWFTNPDVVVAGNDTVSITTGSGDGRHTETTRTEQARAVPAALAGRLSALKAEIVVDYAGYAAADGTPGSTVHPWSAASLHGYTWLSGGPPRTASQIVLTAPAGYRAGDILTVQTAAGPHRFMVSGVISTGAPAAFYATDAEAAALAGDRISAIALTAAGEPAGTLTAQARAAAHGLPVRILTGDGRRAAEPDPDADLRVAAIALLASISGLSAFVSIFVVAGTFGYSVAARRREFGLLRTAGATPRQVRRLVLGEALAVGIPASVAGSLAGAVIANPFIGWLARTGFAPASYSTHLILWPLAAAAGAGLPIALAGAWLASRRAARVRPAEALREASMDTRTMPLIRWLTGLAALGGSVPLIGVLASSHSTSTAALFLPVAMLLTLGCVMFAPLLAPPLIRLLTLPLAASAGATGMLAARGAVAGVRRTVATAAPILLTVGIAGSLLAATGTLNHTQQAAAASRVTAPVIVTAASGTGLADSTVAAIRSVPGVTAAVPVSDSKVYVNSGGPEDWSARYVSGPAVAGLLKLPVTAGDLANLTGTDTIAVPAGTWRLGQTAAIWLDDSTPVRLRVVAVYADQIDLDQTVLLPWALHGAHSQAPVASAVYLRLSPAASLSAARAAARAGGGSVIRTADYLSVSDARQNRTNNLALIAVLGMALAYTGIAIANTLVMAAANRRRELATLRLSGATPGQVLRMIGVETCLVWFLAIALAAAVTAGTVLGLQHGLRATAPSVRMVIPWQPAGGIALACLAVALLASLIPAALTLRHRPLDLVTAGE